MSAEKNALNDQSDSPKELPSFDDLADVLIAEGALTLSPSELHGLLAGQLSAGARFDKDTVLKVLCHLLNIDHLEHDSSKGMMIDVYHATLFQLGDDDLSLRLLLPDDDQEMSQRVDALSSWCSGFLAGFGMYLGDHKMSDSLREGLQDVSEIAQVSSAPDELSDDDEGGLIELEEYVRMVVLFMFAECNLDINPEPDDLRKRLH